MYGEEEGINWSLGDFGSSFYDRVDFFGVDLFYIKRGMFDN